MSTNSLFRITLEPDVAEGGQVVLNAALQLVGDDPNVTLELHRQGVSEVGEADGEWVTELIAGVWPHPIACEVTLVGDAELERSAPGLTVLAGSDVASNARAIVLLSTAAQLLWEEPGEASPEAAPASSDPWAELADPPWTASAPARAARGLAEFEIARRDPHRATAGPMVIVVAAIRAVQWSSLQTVVEALADTPGVELHVVSSPYQDAARDVEAAVRASGVTPEPLTWLEENLGRVHVVISDVPYDFEKPAILNSLVLARLGIRQVYLPYGTPTVGGDRMIFWVYRQPLQQMAWRIYVSSEAFRDEMVAGSLIDRGQVRVLGLPKFDRLAKPVGTERFRALRKAARRRPVFLWNPHFTVGTQDPLSTFDLYVGELLRFFASRPDLHLIIRPHPSLWATLDALGGAAASMREAAITFAKKHDNIVLDESPDYLDAFLTADAMISDASSLISEFLLLGKPVLFLRNPEGPPLNADSGYVRELPVADSWVDVRGWIGETAAALGAGRPIEVVPPRGHITEPGAGRRIAADIVESLREELDGD